MSDTQIDYKNLPNCGGYAMDRPATKDELIAALRARYEVAEERMGDEFAVEWFNDYTRWHKEPEQLRLTKFMEAGRIVAFANLGSNEGYLVHVMLTPVYFTQDRPIDLVAVKCNTRESAIAVLTSFTELILRMG